MGLRLLAVLVSLALVKFRGIGRCGRRIILANLLWNVHQHDVPE